jgi:CRISPR/Cas system CSM-associated protein Csm3 (group 7 of RAMP superfamily)
VGDRLCDRLIIKGRLELPRAWHVGSGQASARADSAVRRGRDGQPYVPGSTLAGLLRAAAEDFAPHLCADPRAVLRGLFGRDRDDDPRDPALGASRLLFEDAVLEGGPLPAHVEVRDHVGIDRFRAAARPHLQYDREVAPGDTRFRLEMALEEPRPDELRLVVAVLDLWAAHGFHLGARTTTGLGAARLERSSVRLYPLDFSSHDLLSDYLLGGKTDPAYLPAAATAMARADVDAWLGTTARAAAPLPDKERFLPQCLFVDVALVLKEPLLIKGNLPEVPDPDSKVRTSDAEFIKATRWDAARRQLVDELYLPGSSLKGVLRTRAEKIIRTLNFYRKLTVEQAEKDIASALADYPGRITACAVTHDEAPEGWSRLESCSSPGRQPHAKELDADGVYERSCLTCRVFGNALMRGRLTCGEATLIAEAKLKLFDHVAIDRFTGGAADARKFDTRPLLPLPTAEAPTRHVPVFTFQLRLERPELWMLGLLGHLLKDLNDGDIRLGHATHRGYGRVRGLVTRAVLLVLPGTELETACGKAGVPLQAPPQDGGQYHGPYRQANLTPDWAGLFGEPSWGTGGPEEEWRQRPGAKLLAAADEQFQKVVAQAEGQQTWQLP